MRKINCTENKWDYRCLIDVNSMQTSVKELAFKLPNIDTHFNLLKKTTFKWNIQCNFSLYCPGWWLIKTGEIIKNSISFMRNTETVWLLSWLPATVDIDFQWHFYINFLFAIKLPSRWSDSMSPKTGSISTNSTIK